jgi:hypothetical protein
MRLADRIIIHCTKRPPDFIIGPGYGQRPDYIRRWWIIPRNPLFNIYVHRIGRNDDDRALHDHPWINVSIVLRGGYVEVTPKGKFWRGEGSIVFRRARAAHRLALRPLNDGSGNGRVCWSLFITGPRIRHWGFHCPKGWVPWEVFTDPANSGAVGRGCGED